MYGIVHIIFGRLFSFGIGEGASTSLVKGIARAGRGKAELIKEGERLQPLVSQRSIFPLLSLMRQVKPIWLFTMCFRLCTYDVIYRVSFDA